MNPLRVVYNITSNKPPRAPRFRDVLDDSESSRSSTPADGLDAGSDADTPLLSEEGEPARSKSTGSFYDRVPLPLRRVGTAVADWVKGPKPPRPWRISPVFPRIQEAPLRLLDAYAPRPWQRFILLLVLYFVYILAFALVLHKSAFAADIPGYGHPVTLSCGATFWYISMLLL